MLACCCINALDPQRTECALLTLAIAVLILQRLLDRLLGDADRILAPASIALGGFEDFLMLGMGGDAPNPYALTIGVGAWLGTFMLFNVWVLIWPNQKKILGMVEASADEIAKAKNIAFLASRSNTLMSIPLVMSMIGAHHGWFM